MPDTKLVKAAAKFMRAADALINASDRVLKHDAGSIMRQKAVDAHAAAGEAYDAARAELQAQVDRANGVVKHHPFVAGDYNADTCSTCGKAQAWRAHKPATPADMQERQEAAREQARRRDQLETENRRLHPEDYQQ
jgi:hypothetical protein